MEPEPVPAWSLRLPTDVTGLRMTDRARPRSLRPPRDHDSYAWLRVSSPTKSSLPWWSSSRPVCRRAPTRDRVTSRSRCTPGSQRSHTDRVRGPRDRRTRVPAGPPVQSAGGPRRRRTGRRGRPCRSVPRPTISTTRSKSFRSRGRITPIRPAVSGSRARSPARCGSEVPERYAVRASSVDPGTDRTPPRWTRSAGSNSNQHVAADVRSTTG